MNICYLLGNGFDLNLKLKTSYCSFLDYYLTTECIDKAKKEDVDSLKTFIKSSGYDQNSLWADCELGFAEYTRFFSNSNIDKQRFLNGYYDFLFHLSKYLEKQESLLKTYNMEPIKKEFLSTLTDFSFRLLPRDREIYNATIASNEDVHIYIINFNYTQSLKQITEDIIYSETPLGKIVGTKRNMFLKRLLHVHGEVGESMILGANDASQLKNPAFADVLVKPTLNEYRKLNTAKNVDLMFESSKVFVVYGMSIGKTDQIWFDKISKQLANHKDKLLIIIGYMDNSVYKYPQEIHFKDESYIQKFLSLSSLNEEQKKAIRDRILVESNTTVFSFEEHEFLSSKAG